MAINRRVRHSNIPPYRTSLHSDILITSRRNFSDSHMIPVTPSKNTSNFQRLFIIASVLLIAAAVAVYNYMMPGVDYRALNDAEWKVTQVGTPWMKFECPVPLEDKSRPPIGQERELIQSNQIFMYQKGYDLYVSASIIDYLPHVYVSPSAVVESVKGFDKQFGAENIQYNPYELIIGTYRTLRTDGSFTINGTKYIFSRVTAEHRNNFRDLLVIVRDDDMEALLVKNRIAATISFGPY